MNFSYLVTMTLWVLPLALQALIALVMLRRKLVTSFPIFFSYTVLVLSGETALLFVKNPSNSYALVYWSQEAFAVLLGLAVIFEILGHILPPSPFMGFVSKSIWIFGAIAAVAALLMLVLTNGSQGADRIVEFIILAERSARFLQACLFIVVIALMSRLGLTWHHYSVGIAAGFGIYSALALTAFELHAHLHFMSYKTLALLNPAAYNVAALIWAFYIVRPWPATVVEHLPHGTNLAEWNEAVGGYINQWYRR
ncbi:MAG: hypothetical protein JWN74_2959 [Acidobacteriaceae bacterium]|nr:hypothetical protein [Acidobacteriaceae bacterium]